jgi:hypothetical protein
MLQISPGNKTPIISGTGGEEDKERLTRIINFAQRCTVDMMRLLPYLFNNAINLGLVDQIPIIGNIKEPSLHLETILKGCNFPGIFKHIAAYAMCPR